MHLHIPISAGFKQPCSDRIFLGFRKLYCSCHISHTNPFLLLHLFGVVVKNGIQFFVTLLGNNNFQEIGQFITDMSVKNSVNHLQFFLFRDSGMLHQHIKLRICRQNLSDTVYFLQQFPGLVLAGFHCHFKQGLTVCLGY